jgi:hypothetical protein
VFLDKAKLIPKLKTDREHTHRLGGGFQRGEENGLEEEKKIGRKRKYRDPEERKHKRKTRL